MKALSLIAVILAAIGLIYFSVINSDDLLETKPVGFSSKPKSNMHPTCRDAKYADLPNFVINCRMVNLNINSPHFIRSIPNFCTHWDNDNLVRYEVAPGGGNLFAKTTNYTERLYLVPRGKIVRGLYCE